MHTASPLIGLMLLAQVALSSHGQTLRDKVGVVALNLPHATLSLDNTSSGLRRDFLVGQNYAVAPGLHPVSGDFDGDGKDSVAMFSAPLGDPGALPVLPNPADDTLTLDARARAYLETNCAGCHQPGGPTPTNLDLRFETLLADTNTCDVMPQAGDLGIGNARILAPGEPDRSVLVERMDRRDANGMPPVASNAVDAEGVTLIRDWISSLSGC